MENFNFGARAELFASRRYAKTNQTQYRRFRTAAEAVQFVIEELPVAARAGSYLEVNEQRFEGGTIRALYDHAAYPLERAH
ncbi:hypothetical protein N8D56_27610 (plasmid) [Devosia sp. A8/3-2]|nr:hypothetical protein N8D56_27610 [Devosia sp. A8/3-2]